MESGSKVHMVSYMLVMQLYRKHCLAWAKYSSLRKKGVKKLFVVPNDCMKRRTTKLLDPVFHTFPPA